MTVGVGIDLPCPVCEVALLPPYRMVARVPLFRQEGSLQDRSSRFVGYRGQQGGGWRQGSLAYPCPIFHLHLAVPCGLQLCCWDKRKAGMSPGCHTPPSHQGSVAQPFQQHQVSVLSGSCSTPLPPPGAFYTHR